MVECNKCGANIKWSKEEGRWVPMDLDGKCHFDTCPKRKRYKNTSIDYTKLGKPKDPKQKELKEWSPIRDFMEQ